MKILIQNLNKKKGLATKLVKEYQPDIMLAQEINLRSESINTVSNTSSRLGYGTAIYSHTAEITNVKKVNSPNSEFGGFIYKKTTIADCMGIQFVSFHGYNGQPMCNVQKLVDHVKAVVAVLDEELPCLFAGDFNSWSQAHLDAVEKVLSNAGFTLDYSWLYPGRTFPLDHAFVRGLQSESSMSFTSDSDHRGAVLEINLS